MRRGRRFCGRIENYNKANSPDPVSRVILLNKPYGVVCQFSGRESRATLAAYVPIPGVYPAGRLDADSEGLLVLTDDGALQASIQHRRAKMPKTYLVQVEGTAGVDALRALAQGVK